MSSIKLSPTHGLNPTMCNCFFCGEVKHIALMGKLKGDAEAPRSCVMDYEPCDTCIERMGCGVTLIEVSEVQPSDGRPPMKTSEGAEVYPLGGWAVISPVAFSRATNREWSMGDRCFVDHEVLKLFTQEEE